MHKTFLSSAIYWFLFVLTVTLVARWLASSRLPSPGGRNDDCVLENPAGILIIGVVGFLLFAVVAIGSFLVPASSPHDQWKKTVLIWVSPVPLGFATLGGYLILWYFRERHRLEPTGLNYRTVFKSGTLRWDEVQSLYYSPSLKWFRIQTDDGKVVHITITLKNLPAFASAVLTNVLPSRIDTGTKAVLNATASGDLPSLQGWGDHIDDGPLRKHTGNLIIGILLIVSMSSLAVLSFLSPGKHGSPWITAMCLGMAAPGGCLIVQYFRVRHHVEPTGMNYRTGFSSGSLRWNEVQSVHYSRMLNWFRIQTKEGSVIHISATLKNLPNLASCILTHVSPSCIDHSTTAALNAAASGRRLSLRG